MTGKEKRHGKQSSIVHIKCCDMWGEVLSYMWDILHHVCKRDTVDFKCCSATLWMNTRFRFLSNSFTVTWNPKLKSKGPSLLHWLETTSAGSFHINSLSFVAFVLFISFKKLCRGNIMCHILCRGVFFVFSLSLSHKAALFIYLFSSWNSSHKAL